MIARRFIFALLMVLVVWILGCEKSPQLVPLSEQATIVAFGDSLTVGVGAQRSQSYPHVLAELSGRQVVNAGVSGEVTSEGRRRFASELAAHEPQLIVLLEGGNDILRNHGAAATKENLAWMISFAREREIDVVLLGVPTKNLLADAAPFYGELAEEYGLVYDDELVPDLLRTPGYKSDAIHLNADGYRAMAEAIYELLQDHGAL